MWQGTQGLSCSAGTNKAGCKEWSGGLGCLAVTPPSASAFQMQKMVGVMPPVLHGLKAVQWSISHMYKYLNITYV